MCAEEEADLPDKKRQGAECTLPVILVTKGCALTHHPERRSHAWGVFRFHSARFA